MEEVEAAMAQLRDIMTNNVATVTPREDVQAVANLMKQHNVGMIPVVENGKLLGVVTDRDLVLRNVADGGAQSSPVSDIMTKNPVTATPEMTVDEASQLMSQRQIRRLPVVDNGQLIGVVAIGDLAVREHFVNEAGEALSNISTPSRPVM